MSSSKSMFMKHVAVIAFAMAVASPAFADDASFKIYGNLDSGVEMVNNVGAGKATVVRVPSTTGTFPSNLGFDMSKDAGGVKAVAKAEMGYYMDAGNSGQGGKLFGRQLYVGVDYGVGTITVGRQNNMMYWGTMAGDPLGPNIYGLGSIDAYIPNARYDNSVAWRGKFDAVSLGVAYSLGHDTAGAIPASGACAGEVTGDAQACRAISFMAQYDASNFAVAAAYDRLNGGGTKAANFYNGAATVGLTSSSDHDTRTSVNGFYKIDALKLAAGLLRHKADNATTSVSQSTTWLEAVYSMDKWQYLGGVFHVSNSDQSTKANMLVLRAVYNFDNQLSSYATLGYMGNDTTSDYGVSGGGPGTAPAVGNKQDGLMIGARYHF